MPATLASLLRTTALRLTVLTGDDRLGAAVRWVHTSELDDPAPYLEGGELLLTTGLKLNAADRAALRGYVRRLDAAGVVGLGFGVGLSHKTVPRALVDAARECGLPLLEVPRATPFIAISKAVHAALAADRYQAVTRGFEAQRDLTSAALAPDGPAALLTRLAAQLDGWAALYDASGAVVAVAPDWAGRRAARLAEAGEIDRLRRRSAPASAAVAYAAGPGGGEDHDGNHAGDRVELQALGTGRRPCGFLAVGTGERLDTAARYSVHAAVALLTLSLEQSRALQEAQQRLGAALLRLLLAGRAEQARTVAGTLYGGLLDAPLRVLVAEAPPDAAGLLADHVETAAGPALAVRDGDRLTVLTAEGGPALAAFLRLAAADPDDPRLSAGVSSVVDADGVPRAHDEAERALAVARRRARGVVRYEEVGAGSVLPLLGDDAVRAFADELLRPLRAHDATSRGDLVASLGAWLTHHGQWDAAAAELGVHRHTLRYRMRRVEEILGRSLDDTDTRMELWLALKASTGHFAVP